MSLEADHVVRPTCPHCGRRVRSGLEIRQALLDAGAAMARAEGAQAEELDAGSDAGLLDACALVEELRVELAGEHLACAVVAARARLADSGALP